MRKSSIGFIALSFAAGVAISALVTVSIMNVTDDDSDIAGSNETSEMADDTTSIAENIQDVNNRQEVAPNEDSSKSKPNDNPQEAWNALISDDIEDIGQLDKLLKIAELLMEEEGFLNVLDQLVNSQIDDIVRDTILKFVVHTAELKNPEDAFQQVMYFSPVMQELALPAIVKAWAKENPTHAFDAISNLDSSKLRTSLEETLFRVWAEHDPELALQTVLNQPLYKSEFGFERGLEELVIAEVAKHDLDKAIAMLPQIRSGDARLLKAYSSIGSELVTQAEYDRALKLGQGLPKEINDKYLNTVLGSWAKQEPDTMFDSLDTNIWTAETKEKAAANLLVHHSLTASAFDSVQTEKLIGLIEDQKMVRIEFAEGEELLTTQIFREGENVLIPPFKEK